MSNGGFPAPPQCALSAARPLSKDTEKCVEAILSSPPIRSLRAKIGSLGLTIERIPILSKYMSGSWLRVMFPVTGAVIEEGAVVSVVCLYDVQTGETLYAHPMHAGPGVNPMLKAVGGPMASPKAQPGLDGDRATMRIMEHKRALWDRFDREQHVLGQTRAGQRWLSGYYWSLKRLYFCNRCTKCKWGSPFFDGPDQAAPRKPVVLSGANDGATLTGPYQQVVSNVLASDAWRRELVYACRGGFCVSKSPRILKELPNDQIQILFPTTTCLIQEGSLVGVAVTYDRPSANVVFAHHLSAGAGAEIEFLLGERALGLPSPQEGNTGEEAKVAYRNWRRDAWSRFWLDELENGLDYASGRWLTAFWSAMEALFGRNDLELDLSTHPSACNDRPTRRN